MLISGSLDRLGYRFSISLAVTDSEIVEGKNSNKNMKGYMYILKCSNGAYYTGSTNNLELRLEQHQKGEGAQFTRRNLPVEIVYFEEFNRIDEAFYREKQIQKWSRRKKEALIKGDKDELVKLSKSYTQNKDLKRR